MTFLATSIAGTTSTTGTTGAGLGGLPTLTTQPTVSSTTTAAAASSATATAQKPISVPTPSTLKNKSMEEILNLWTKELEKQTKDFHQQANQVAKWDQQLIENGNKISQLHDNVTKVEVTQREIDQNLEYINSQQEELNTILDSYEKQIKEVFDESNLQQPMQPADLQREKAYGLAENLNSQLDDVNKNLNIMVDEINKMGGNSRQVASEDDDVVSFLSLSFLLHSKEGTNHNPLN